MIHKLLKIWISLCFCSLALSVLIAASNTHSVFLSGVLLTIVCASWMVTWEIDTIWSNVVGNALVRTQASIARTLAFIAQSVMSVIAVLCWYGN